MKYVFKKLVNYLAALMAARPAGDFIVPNNEIGGRAPDLIIFKPGTKLFRFVECKGKDEHFTQPQPTRFTARKISEYFTCAREAKL